MAETDTSPQYLRSILAHPGSCDPLSVLTAIQDEYHYLPESALKEASTITGVRLGDLVAIAGFYERFRLQPAGEHRIRVCTGTACFVKGADRLLEELKRLLGIGEGETTKDGRFSLGGLRCVGACSLAPVVMVNDRVYGNVTPQMVPQILNDCE